MDHERIATDMVISRYVRGDLPPALHDAFEAHYLGCHDCLEQLEVETRLAKGLKRAALADLVRADAVNRAGRLGILGWLGRRRGLAFGVVFGLVAAMLPAALLWRELDSTRAELAVARAPNAGTRVLYLDAVRGGGAPTNRIALDAVGEWVVLTLALDERVVGSSQVTLLRGDKALWHAVASAPDASGTVAISLPTEMLESGRYRIRVAPDDRDQPVRFVFDVVDSGG